MLTKAETIGNILKTRCVFHPYLLAQRDTDLLEESAHLSRAIMCIDVSCFSSDPYKDKRATLNKKQKNETYNSETLVTETNQASWNLLINTISHCRTIANMTVSAIEASKKAVGYSFKILDPGKNGWQLTDEFAMNLKNDFVSRDANIFFLHIPFQDGGEEKSVGIYLLEVDPSQNANGNVKAMIIADTRHIQRRSERNTVLMLRDGLFCNSPATPEHPRSRTRAYSWYRTKLGRNERIS